MRLWESVRRAFFALAFIFVTAQAGAGNPMQVDGVPVDGRTDLVSASDISDAIVAFKGSEPREPVRLTVISKDVMHAYIPQQDMGWITVKRTDFVDPDHVRHTGWISYWYGLPDLYEAMHCIKNARDVYVFPITTPRKPHRDGEHERLLGAEARSKLVDLLGSPSDWTVGFNNLIYPDTKSAEVGLVFQNGKDELVLFFFHNTVTGTFNGEHLSGTLSTDPSWEMHDWKQRYAQPELATTVE